MKNKIVIKLVYIIIGVIISNFSQYIYDNFTYSSIIKVNKSLKPSIILNNNMTIRSDYSITTLQGKEAVVKKLNQNQVILVDLSGNVKILSSSSIIFNYQNKVNLINLNDAKAFGW